VSLLLLWSTLANGQAPPPPPPLTFDPVAPKLERAERWHRFGRSSAAIVGVAGAFAATGGAFFVWDRLALCGSLRVPPRSPDGWSCQRFTWRSPILGISIYGSAMYGTLSAPAVTVTSLGTGVAIRRSGHRVSLAPGVLAALGLVGTFAVLVDDDSLESPASKAAYVTGLVVTNGLATWQVALNDRALKRRRAARNPRSP